MKKIDYYSQGVDLKTAIALKVLQGSFVVTYFIFRRSPNFVSAIIILEVILGVLILLYFFLFHRKKLLTNPPGELLS